MSLKWIAVAMMGLGVAGVLLALHLEERPSDLAKGGSTSVTEMLAGFGGLALIIAGVVLLVIAIFTAA